MDIQDFMALFHRVDETETVDTSSPVRRSIFRSLFYVQRGRHG